MLEKLPPNLLNEISPSSKFLKKNLKVPMIFMTLTGGILNSMSLVLFKSGSEIVKTNIIEGYTPTDLAMSLGLMTVAGSLSISNIFLLNKTFCLYNNLDVMPSYQSFILLMLLFSGLLVFNE